ncbi:MAG: condensation domain-containing protein, partial [Psychrosphaera sp.]|nr:condensation domain-containing protein [Psychrosphaera sp.]
LFAPLVHGCTLVLPGADFDHSPRALMALMAAHNISILFSSVGWFNALYSQKPDIFAGWRYLMVGGEVLDAELFRQLMRQQTRPQHLLAIYGPTETTTYATSWLATEFNGSVPIGVGHNTRQIYVLDSNNQLVPSGVPGELCIAGAGLARGYLNQPKLTDAAFIDNPFADASDVVKGYHKLYKSGDIVRWRDDGQLEYLGRNDSQVKIRGFRIELGDIQQHLSQLEAVKQAAVVVNDGQGHKYLAAYVVVDSQCVAAQALDVAQVRRLLADKLPDYMLPSTLTVLDEIPLTSNGKLDSTALPAPQLSEPCTYVAPSNELEQQLCQLWQSALGLEKVGIEDNFYQLGGNSIIAIGLTAQAQQLLGLEIPLALLFSQKTIKALAERLSEQGTEQVNSAMVIKPANVTQYPLSFAQERFLFIEQFEQGSEANHIPYLVELTTDVDFNCLTLALNQLIERHPILTTIYHKDSQHIVDEPLKIITKTVSQSISKTVSMAIRQPFDLSKDGPMRVGHYLDDGHQYLLIVWHHIAFDGWSSGLFLSQLSDIYQALLRGIAVTLPVPEITYGDYALWQREYLQGEVLQVQTDFWQHSLAGYEVLNLPTDYARPSHICYEGQDYRFSLPGELSNQLRDLAKHCQVSLYTFLISAFYHLLS